MGQRLRRRVMSPGNQAMALHRLASACRRKRMRTASRALVLVGRWATGIEIGAGATIGRNLRIKHGMGTVIGGRSRIGDDCCIFHGVTIGMAGPGSDMPTIGDRVVIYAGAVVVGSITIGDDVVIAANAVVTEDVPAGATVGGVPAAILKRAEVPRGAEGAERVVAD